MAGNLSLSIAINLLTDNFKKGTNTVKNAFRSMQMQFLTFAAALGAGGLGISGFVSGLIDIARQTSRVSTALKNVSGSTAQYANNQRFMLDMAKKYGLEINALTGSFAKFTAAATISGMSMEQQQKIFESVSRATTAFGMSAEDSNSVFLALSQMMSKGKISSEELRLQMGERLPIALQAMAKAAGVTVAELDGLLKQGKLMSADVLPKFANALNEMIPNVNTDNLETSINRLKNVFTEFAKSTGIQEYYKGLIDNITKLVKYGANNIKSIINQLIAVLVGVIGGRFIKWVSVELAKAQRSAMIEAAKAAKKAGEEFDAVAWKAQSGAKTMEAAFVRAGRAIKATMISMLPTAIIMVISSLVAKLINIGEEAKRIRSIFSDYKKDSMAVGRPEDSEKLQRLYKIASDTTQAYGLRKSALSEINEMLGTSYSIDQKNLGITGDINTKIAERIKLLKDVAAVEFYQTRKLQAESDANAIIAKYGNAEGLNRAAKISAGARSTAGGAIAKLLNLGGINDAYDDAQAVNGFKRIWEDANKQLELLTKDLLSNKTGNTNTASLDAETESLIKKAETEYANSLRELTNQRENEAITEKAYIEELDKLNKSTYLKLSGILTPDEASKNKTYQETKDGFNNSEADQIIQGYWKSMNDYSAQFTVGAITEKEYLSAKLQLIDKVLKELGILDNLNDANIGFIESLKKTSSDLLKVELKDLDLKSRDATFDYKKNPAEIADENLNVAKQNLAVIKEAIEKGADNLTTEFNTAIANVDSLEEALKLAKIQQDVKEFSKEINGTLYSGVKDIAGSADRVVSAFRNLKDVFNDVDSSGWERIMSAWNMMAQAVDSFTSILETIKTLTELTSKLAGAKKAEAAIDNLTTQQKITNDAKQALSAITTEGIVNAANKKEVAGNTAAAGSAAAKSVAGIPIVGLIMAGAAVAGIIALMASLPKFARGGIVGGNSTSGDNNLVRADSGEMILTRRQQATLFRLANGNINSQNNRGGEVVFRINGDALEGVLKNYNRKQRRIG